jgi:hypothetical protein
MSQIFRQECNPQIFVQKLAGLLALASEAEFLDVIRTKVFRDSSLLFTVTSTTDLTPPPPPPHPTPGKSGWKRVCNVNIVYRNFKSENSQDYGPETSMKLYVHEFAFWTFISVPRSAACVLPFCKEAR